MNTLVMLCLLGGLGLFALKYGRRPQLVKRPKARPTARPKARVQRQAIDIDLVLEENFAVIVFLLAPVLFLPLLAPRYLLPVVPLEVVYLVADVPDLAPHVDGLRSAFERLHGVELTLPLQQVHGDLHLGQVLRTVHGWLLLDFEGEPAASLAERHALRSPLRDVAGMLRSFDYAAQQLLVGQPADEERTARATAWAQHNRRAFCDGYAASAGRDPRDDAALLRGLELDKAVYEVSYEHSNRPDWSSVPLGSIARILDEGE